MKNIDYLTHIFDGFLPLPTNEYQLEIFDELTKDIEYIEPPQEFFDEIFKEIIDRLK